MRSVLFKREADPKSRDVKCRAALNQEIFQLMEQRMATVNKFTKLGSLIKLSNNKVTHHMMKSLAVLTWNTGVKFGILMQRRGYKQKLKLKKVYSNQMKNLPSGDVIAYVKKQLKKTKSKMSEKLLQQSVRSYGLIIWLFAVNHGQNFINQVKQTCEKRFKYILNCSHSNVLLSERKSLIYFRRKKRKKYYHEDEHEPFQDINEDIEEFIVDRESYNHRKSGRCELSTIAEVSERESSVTFVSTNEDGGLFMKQSNSNVSVQTEELSLWTQYTSDLQSKNNSGKYKISSGSSLNSLFDSSIEEKTSEQLLDSMSKTISDLINDHLYFKKISKDAKRNEIVIAEYKTESTQTLNLINDFMGIHNISMLLQHFEKHMSLLRVNFEQCLSLIRKQADQKIKSICLKNIGDNFKQQLEFDLLEFNEDGSDFFSKMFIISNPTSGKDLEVTTDSESKLMPNKNTGFNSYGETISTEHFQDVQSLKLESLDSGKLPNVNVLYKSDEFDKSEYNSAPVPQFKQITETSNRLSEMLLNSNNDSGDEKEKIKVLKAMFVDIVQDQIELTKLANKIIKCQADEIEQLVKQAQQNEISEYDKVRILNDNATTQKLIKSMNYFDEQISKINSNLDSFNDSDSKDSIKKSKNPVGSTVVNTSLKKPKSKACQIDLTNKCLPSEYDTENDKKVFKCNRSKDQVISQSILSNNLQTKQNVSSYQDNFLTHPSKNYLTYDLNLKNDENGLNIFLKFVRDVWYATFLLLGIIFMTFLFLAAMLYINTPAYSRLNEGKRHL